jgi:YtkA-like
MRRVAFLALLVSQAAFAQKTDAGLDCKHTGQDFIYNCVIRLARAGEPLTDAQVTVGADMPSMPMAHQIKPVKAEPTKTAGEYRARLDLEMSGEWAVKLRLAGPVRDQLVLHYEFDERGARPVRRSAHSPRK